MSKDIHKVRVRNALKPRREPYWATPIARGKFVGFRKIDATTGTWIARLRDEGGRQQYKSLGYVSDRSTTIKRTSPLPNGSIHASPALLTK